MLPRIIRPVLLSQSIDSTFFQFEVYKVTVENGKEKHNLFFQSETKLLKV